MALPHLWLETTVTVTLRLSQSEASANACMCTQVRPGAYAKGDVPGAVASAAVAVACLLATTGFLQGNQHPTSMVQQHTRTVALQLQQQGAEGEAGTAAVSCFTKGWQRLQRTVLLAWGGTGMSP